MQKKKNTNKAKPTASTKCKPMYYAVCLAEKDLCDMVALDLLGLFKLWKSICKDYAKGHHNNSKEDKETVSDTCKQMFKYLDLATRIFSDLDSQWKSVLFEYADETKLPADLTTVVSSDECKTPAQKKPSGKKQKKISAPVHDFHLTEAERKSIEDMRLNKKMSIKAIGKAIHRAEKVVADYVHSIS